MNALLKPKGVQLKSLWRKASPKLDFVDSEKTNVYVLQVMSILRQAYCSPKYCIIFCLAKRGWYATRRVPFGRRSWLRIHRSLKKSGNKASMHSNGPLIYLGIRRIRGYLIRVFALHLDPSCVFGSSSVEIVIRQLDAQRKILSLVLGQRVY